jgi:pSer/pThr/pTyr-binding forkhead associated (FHA) protein
MTELWLKFTDARGETRRVSVEGEKFVVGRHSENDLSIPESSLSRKHLKIERFGDVFVVSDLGSSNGTKLNETLLEQPAALKKGDVLNLGGGIEIEVEIVSDAEDFGDSAATGAAEKESEDQAEIAAQVSGAEAVAASSATGGGNSFSISFFILAPLLGFCFLGIIGGGIYLLSGGTSTAKKTDSNFIRSDTPRPDKTVDEEEDETPKPTAKPTESVSVTPSVAPTDAPSTPSPNTDDADKVERSALAFTRRIALNDNNYVFSRKQIAEITSRVKNFSGSSAMRDNLKAVRQNAAQFEQLAESKGLKPQFLATAALARLGNNRGNPLQTAQAMLPVLGELKITLGNELADDNLLIIAAFEQGERGENRAMRNTVEVLSKEPGVDVRRARTVWYVREKGKMSDAQYEFALRFLAIGAIAQNPKDFGVETEPVVFN